MKKRSFVISYNKGGNSRLTILLLFLFCCGIMLAQGTPGLYFYPIGDTAYGVSRGTANDSHIEIPEIYDGLPVTEIGFNGFSGFTEMTSISIPNSVTYIWADAFRGCTNLATVTIPNSVLVIDDFAFSFCTGLTSVTLGNSLTIIGFQAFVECRNLGSIDIPESVTTLRGVAFYVCTSLTSVTIPSSVTQIGMNPFAACFNLETIYVSEENTHFRSEGNALIRNSDNSLISGTKNTIIPSTVTRIDNAAFGYCRDLTSIFIPNSVTYIDTQAFWGCIDLEFIYIPISVEYIGGSAFRENPDLTIYAVIESQPISWHPLWNFDDRPVVWGCVDNKDPDTPSIFTELKGNYPNPFNPSTSIKLSISVASNLRVDIYNFKGQKIKTLVDDFYPAGEHSVVWNGTDDYGTSVASGVYFYRMIAGEYVGVGKMVMMK